MTMNWDIIKWNFEQFTWVLKKKYAEFTDDEIAEIEANGEILAGKLQENTDTRRMKQKKKYKTLKMKSII